MTPMTAGTLAQLALAAVALLTTLSPARVRNILTGSA